MHYYKIFSMIFLIIQNLFDHILTLLAPACIFKISMLFKQICKKKKNKNKLNTTAIGNTNLQHPGIISRAIFNRKSLHFGISLCKMSEQTQSFIAVLMYFEYDIFCLFGYLFCLNFQFKKYLVRLFRCFFWAQQMFSVSLFIKI